MEELTNIAKLLGEENEKRLKDTITDLLIQQVEEDLDSMCVYLIDFESMMCEIRKDVERAAKEKLINGYMEKFHKKMDELFEGNADV